MKPMFKATGVALAMLLAVPAAAQNTPPPPNGGQHGQRGGGGAGKGAKWKMQMFASLSPAGQTTMRDAMKSVDNKADRAAVKTARDAILAALDADKLDVAALKRAMESERSAAESMHNKRQTALLGAYQKLSLADRKALVAEAREMRTRMDARMAKGGGKGRMHGDGMDGMDDMPPPPPPPAR